MKLSPKAFFVGSALTAVFVAVVAGLFALGSPTEERSRRVDLRRVEDLQAIMMANDLYLTRHSRLPTSLAELTDEPGVSIGTQDPESSESYGYQTLDSIRYELCADFELSSGEMARSPARNRWAHGSGRQCFQLEAERITRDPRRR